MKEYPLTIVVMRDQTVLLVPERGDPFRLNGSDAKLLIRILEQPVKPTAKRDRSDPTRVGELTGRQWLTLQYLDDRQQPAKATSAAGDLSLPTNSVSALLTGLKKMGYATNDDSGYWSLTPAGRTRLEKK